MDGQRGDISWPDNTPNRKPGAQLVAALFEVVAEKPGGQGFVDEASRDQVDPHRREVGEFHLHHLNSSLSVESARIDAGLTTLAHPTALSTQGDSLVRAGSWQQAAWVVRLAGGPGQGLEESVGPLVCAFRRPRDGPGFLRPVADALCWHGAPATLWETVDVSVAAVARALLFRMATTNERVALRS